MADSVTYTQLETAVRQWVKPSVSDVASRAHYVYEKIMSRVNRHAGLKIATPIEYAQNKNHGTIKPRGKMEYGHAEVVTYAYHDWVTYYQTVFVSNLEMKMCGNDKEKVFDLAAVQIKNAQKSFESMMSRDLIWGDGGVFQEPGGPLRDTMTGLLAVVAANTAYGGITPATLLTNPWWNPYVMNMLSTTIVTTGGTAAWLANETAADLTVSTSPVYLPRVMNHVLSKINNGRDKCDLILADTATYNALRQIFLGKQEPMKEAIVGKLGQDTLQWRNIDIMEEAQLDNGATGSLLFLNTDHLEMHVLKGVEGAWSGLRYVSGDVEGQMGDFTSGLQLSCDARNRFGYVYNVPLYI